MEDSLVKNADVQPLLSDSVPASPPPSDSERSASSYNQSPGYGQPAGYPQQPQYNQGPQYGSPPQSPWGGYGSTGNWGPPGGSPVININQSSNNDNHNNNSAGGMGGGMAMMSGGDAGCFHITSGICAILSILLSPIFMLIPMCMLCCCCSSLRSPLDSQSGARQFNKVCTILMIIFWSVIFVIIAIPTLGVGLVFFVTLIPAFIVLHAINTTQTRMLVSGYFH